MPANLTPMYRKAEEAFRQAKTAAEKIAALEEMYATIPKHKGTEKMQADIKHRLAKLRETAQQQKGRTGVDHFHVERQGAGQFVLVGLPNSGKSALVGALTKAHVTVAPYPFSTHLPVPGMMPFEDIQIQLVDTPPVTPEGVVPGMTGTIRAADGLLVCADLAADPLEQADACLRVLEGRGIVPLGRAAPEGGLAMRMILVGTKLDLPGAAENFAALRELYQGILPTVAASAQTWQGLGEIPRTCFEMLGIVRIYSKEPGKPPDMEKPFVLPRGSTVLDVAAAIHKDIAAHLKRARIWGANVYDGQPVHRDHVLADRDVIELHV
ncbi:MAG TPA: TGS domain-containing protein [Phycisphaerae bacterium]|nr:TGS domain-containing protein [Phycisphaerae bacterium]